MDSTPEAIEAVWLGQMAFDTALELQLATREALVAGAGGQKLFAVEHPPTVTMGRRASEGDVLWSSQRMEAAGMSVHETPRGGEATLHAPGQLVVYPVVRVGRRIRAHIERMGRVASGMVRDMGVAGAEFRMEHPGVWVGDAKVGSIGIHISRGVAVQGLSLNLDVKAGLFDALISCGLRGVEVTSVASLGGTPLDVETAGRMFAERFAQDWGAPLRWGEPPTP